MSTEAHEMFERLRTAEDVGLRNTLGLAAHEKECSIRYGHINETMSSMHRSVSGVRRDFRNAAVALIGLLVGVLGFLIKLVFFR